MVRIAGVNIPDKKRFVVALTYVYGVGRARAEKICRVLKINTKLRTHEVKEETLKKVRDLIMKQSDEDDGSGYVGKIEGDLRREQRGNVKRLKEMGCYRGIRHVRGLPTRGQRTHTNARTKKGKARPIAGKKKAS